MSAQLSLAAQPVACVEFAAAEAHERELEHMLAAVATTLDDDARSNPTARNLAERLWCKGEEGARYGSRKHSRAHLLLVELERRGAVRREHRQRPSYFSRDDEPATVTRWALTSARTRATSWARRRYFRG